MNGDAIGVDYYFQLIIWVAAPVLVFKFHSRHGKLPGLFLYSYILAFFMAHWPGALVHASPWSNFFDSTDTVSGFRLSTYALTALLVGALIWRKPRGQTALELLSIYPKPYADLGDSARLLLVIGLGSWFLSFTAVGNLPSAAAVISAGKQCLLLAICLRCRNALIQRDPLRFRIWLLVAFSLPIFTVVTSGFIGYGIAMLAIVMLFISMFYWPRKVILFAMIVGVYAGLSFWIAYAENRRDIRDAVWGEQDVGVRFEAISKVFKDLEPFNIANERHLSLIDLRLNQNELVGAAIRTTPEFVPYADGGTFLEAVSAVIPRALWPEKPVVAGSGDYVSIHTGIEFSYGTSVGMGQVLEFYINFGVPAVIVGFVLLGMLLRWLDLGFTQSIETGDYAGIQFYFLVGTGALQAGGALSEVVASMAGGVVMALALSMVSRRAAVQRETTQMRSLHRSNSVAISGED